MTSDSTTCTVPASVFVPTTSTPQDRHDPQPGLLGVSLGTSMGCSLKSEGLLRMIQEERELLAEEVCGHAVGG